MIFLALWIIALVLALAHVSIARLWRRPLDRATIFLLYQMTVALGLVGFLAFAGHVLRPAEITARIGWPTHPNFQFELGAACFGLRGRSVARAVDTQSPLLAWRRSRPLHFHRPGRHQSST